VNPTIWSWLPNYCHPSTFLPTVQETIVLFREPPYLFQDFVGLAIAFLRSEDARKMGFQYDPRTALPCKWKCSDESLFGVDLCIYAWTGHYPFDKGRIGGYFNETALGAAVHHSRTNIDFGGAHVGYLPGPDGGRFGTIARPLRDEEPSTDCGHLLALLQPFKAIYDDACRTILFYRPEGERVLVSIPNEFLQPGWSRHRIKLLVDVERLTGGLVPYHLEKRFTHKLPGRSLFHVSDAFLESLDPQTAALFATPEPTPIGRELTVEWFHIYDSAAEVRDGLPVQRILPYMRYILSSKVAPYPLKAAVTAANLEYNTLTDAVRAEEFRPYSFASFTGIFIDMYDEELRAYVNLFQPIGISLKPAGRTREVEITPAEIHARFRHLEPVPPALPLEGVLGYPRPKSILSRFTFG
ncbi:MAG: hypothetical protein MUE73_13740, partial [Planctomycetes bacterium]|jgi:hypothetical protein|nr:hypothetical protein [Planctomycetota bacterium]